MTDPKYGPSEDTSALQAQPSDDDLGALRDLLDIQELESRLEMACGDWWDLPCGDTSPSDRNVKENIEPVDTQALLHDLVALPVFSWNYIADPQSPHIGPMAQDFHGTFGLGKDDRTISHVDANGVTLGAIQGLYQVLRDSNALLADARVRIDQLEAQIGAAAVAH
jgi:hypothetical protein